MNAKEDLQELFANGHQRYLRNISIDCTIFGFHENELKLLLVKPLYIEKWALPGGFIRLNESMDKAAERILNENTGLENIYLQQFNAFGDASRATQKSNQKLIVTMGLAVENSWLLERFVTIGYYALIDFTKVNAKSTLKNDNCTWFSVNELPELMLDHADIFNNALKYLRLQLNYHQIGSNLLPAKFTMPELQRLYETILGHTLDRRNFNRKITAANILKKLDEQKVGGAHRAAFLYKFDKRKLQLGVMADK